MMRAPSAFRGGYIRNLLMLLDSIGPTEKLNIGERGGGGVNRVDNISDTALRSFREHYSDDTITKDDIFDYIYGILHAPSYKEQFANDFVEDCYHISPMPQTSAPSLRAGKALADLHLNYETCERFPNLKVEPRKQDLFWEEKPEHFLLGTRAMRFAD